MTPPSVIAFLMRCADLGLSAHIGTTYDTAHLVDDGDGGKECQWIVKVNSIKHSTVKRVRIRAVGGNPWIAAGKAEEKLKAIITPTAPDTSRPAPPDTPR